MQASDHLLSEYSSLERQIESGALSADGAVSRAQALFARGVSSLIGPTLTEEVFAQWRERQSDARRPDLQALGYRAAFLLGEFDGASMSLKADEWEDLRDAITAEAGDLDLELLNELMSALLDRGVR